MKEIICAGFGGQGVLLSGLLLATAGMKSGKNVTWYPSYGSEMRGGTANCNIKISDDEIASPYAKKLDILICMNDASITKFEKNVKPNGILVVNSSLIKEGRTFRDDINVYAVPATDIANELGNPRGTNVTMLGAAVAASGLFDKEFFKEAIDEYFANKGKNNPKNAECFDAGASKVVKVEA